ncbi:MAG: CHAP domain-containing protein [Betaproteobacteria bacterium]|nr:CHAP domain-containing protein [Betaproteobacteria bacterium]
MNEPIIPPVRTAGGHFIKRKILFALFLLVLFIGAIGFYSGYPKFTENKTDYNVLECSDCPRKVGDPIDSFNGVIVYYNGHVPNVIGRNLTADNYNLGLKYQCVEFVKRYYYEFYGHKMPDPWGHAVDFFDPILEDGQRNERRDLTQYRNPSRLQPRAGDLVVFDGSYAGGYGHVAIVSDVREEEIEIIQQNPGAYGNSRVSFSLKEQDGAWHIGAEILGWLRKD